MATFWKASALAALMGVLLLSATAYAVSPVDKCEASKLGTAGKYDFCRLKAEAKAVKIGGAPDFSKCDPKFSDKWSQAETTAGGMCPSNGDEAAVQAFITEHTDALEAALDGGTLPEGVLSCNADLATCNGSLGTCNDSLTTCIGDRYSCGSDLTAAQDLLSTCNATLAFVNAGTAAEADVLSGKTFSSGAGLLLSGTMANQGAQVITPGVADQAIAVGYHNGSGKCVGDADLAASNIVNGVNIFGVAGTAGVVPSQPLQTGQTTAYGTGSDGNLQKGDARSYTDNGDGTITDNKTGLMWEKKSQDGSIHDWTNTYTWSGASYGSTYIMDGTITSTFLAALNGGGGFAGHTDWRIPNVNELQSIANYGTAYPAVDPAFNTSCAASCTLTTCSCIASGSYVSSTTLAGSPRYAWFAYFANGAGELGDKQVSYYVRAVRGGS